MSSLPPLPVAVPFIAAGFTAMTRNRISGRWLNGLAILVSAFVTTVACLLFIQSLAGREVYWSGGWQPRAQVALGIALVVDPMAAFFAALAGVLSVVSLTFSSRYFDDIRAVYQILMLAFLGAMCGFSLTGDLFNLFVFFELMSAAGIALCAYQTEAPGPVQGSLNFAITNTVGGFMILSGIGLLHGRTGALNMAQIGLELDRSGADGLVAVALLLLVCGFLVKAAIVPFHFWLADAHAVAPTPVCILLSGVMVQLGLYGVVRVYWTIFAGPLSQSSHVIRGVLTCLGALTAVLGGLMCLAQRDIKRLLAFSTISHAGVLLAGLGMLDRLSSAGAAVYVLAHAMFKSSLFFGAGILRHRFSDTDENRLQGRGRLRERALTATGAVFVLGGLGLAGVPPLGLFLGQSLMDESAERSGYGWLIPVGMAAAILTGGAVLRVAGRVFLGWGGSAPQPGEPGHHGRETQGGGGRVPWVMLLPALATAAAGAGLGLVPGVSRMALQSAGMLVDRAAYIGSVFGGSVPHGDSMPFQGPLSGLWRGALTAALAVLLAGCWLALSAIPRSFQKAMRPLRRAHSGHPGDYVTWMTIGAAAIGVLFIALFRVS